MQLIETMNVHRADSEKIPKGEPDCLIHSMNSGHENLLVPEGVNDILKTLYREVLREQPKDVVSFMAIFLEEMLIVQDPGRIRAHHSTYHGI